MSDQSQGSGWWQASDAKWYPPETHPSHPQQPTAPPPAPVVSATARDVPLPPAKTGGSRRWMLWASIGVGALIGLGGFGVFIVANQANSPDTDVVALDEGTEPTQEDGNANSGDETSDPDDTDGDVGDEGDDAVDEPATLETTAPEGGTRDTPWAFGVPTAVTFDVFGDADGSVWNVTVGAPEDLTATVLAANDFNDPPPEGVAFVGFPVSMSLTEAVKVPLSPGFNVTWELLGGSTAAVYDVWTIEDLFGCGLLPGELNSSSEVFVGGTLAGTVCIPLPAEDVGHPLTQVALNFSGGDRVIFAGDGVTGSAAGPPVIDDTVATGSGSGDRQAPHPFDTATTVTFETFGDADGSVWDIVVGAPRDITTEVLAENTYNDPPPDGVLFVGFSVDMALVEADKEPLSPGFNLNWELLGGATHAVYTYGTIGGGFGCGVVPGEFDAYSEVFASGNLTGTVCILLPVEDLGLATTQVALNFAGGDRVVFGQ